MQKDDFEGLWGSMSPEDREHWASNCLVGLHGKAFEVCIDRAMGVTKLTRARELAKEVSGEGPFVRAALIWFVGCVAALGVFFLDLPLWVRICAAIALIVVAGKLATRLTFLILRNTALAWPHVFREFWESGVVAIRFGGETYSNSVQATRWQDVLLLAVGYPQLCEVAPKSHAQILDAVLGKATQKADG